MGRGRERPFWSTERREAVFFFFFFSLLSNREPRRPWREGRESVWLVDGDARASEGHSGNGRARMIWSGEQKPRSAKSRSGLETPIEAGNRISGIDHSSKFSPCSGAMLV